MNVMNVSKCVCWLYTMKGVYANDETFWADTETASTRNIHRSTKRSEQEELSSSTIIGFCGAAYIIASYIPRPDAGRE